VSVAARMFCLGGGQLRGSAPDRVTRAHNDLRSLVPEGAAIRVREAPCTGRVGKEKVTAVDGCEGHVEDRRRRRVAVEVENVGIEPSDEDCIALKSHRKE
jgi:hypothetical protein